MTSLHAMASLTPTAKANLSGLCSQEQKPGSMLRNVCPRVAQIRHPQMCDTQTSTKDPHWQRYRVVLAACCCCSLSGFWTACHCCDTVAINFNLKPVTRHWLQPVAPRLQIRLENGERARLTMPQIWAIPWLPLTGDWQQHSPDDEPGGK